MDFGVAYFPTHNAMAPDAVARLVEDRGFTSLFFAEHTHIPASRITPHAGGGLPEKYVRTYDLFVALTAAAMATTRLRVGSGVCLIIERDPIITAKEVASIDTLSGGRVELGIGAGWNREEMINHGTDPRVRMKIMQERVEAMKEIWTHEEASYDGEYVSFDQIWSWPKPAQRPHPPVLVGGSGPGVLDRVLTYGDGWIPSHGEDRIRRGNELSARAERSLIKMVMSVPMDPKVFEAYEKAGFSRVIPWIESNHRSGIERQLDAYESAISEYHGSSFRG